MTKISLADEPQCSVSMPTMDDVPREVLIEERHTKAARAWLARMVFAAGPAVVLSLAEYTARIEQETRARICEEACDRALRAIEQRLSCKCMESCGQCGGG